MSQRGLPKRSILDAGDLPVGEIAHIARREGIRPRAAYQAHKWFARRLAATARSLLVAATAPEGAPSTWGGAWRGKLRWVGGRHDTRHQVPLRRLPLSRRDHQPRRLALLPLSPEPAHGGGDAGGPRHRGEP